MKIIHIITDLSTGGAERMLVKLIKSSQMHNHHVISLKNISIQGEILENMGIPVYELSINGILSSINSLVPLSSIVKQISPDLIQGWMYHGNIAATVASKLTGQVPVVYNIRHSLYDIRLEKTTIQAAIKFNSWLSRSCSKIIYNSKTSKNQHENFGFAKDKSVVIPNGFDTTIFRKKVKCGEEIREEFNIPNSHFIFCNVGRNHPMKDHANFVQSSMEVLKRQNNVCFFLIGRGVNKNNKLQRMVEKTKFKKNIFLIGERSDIASFWNAADCAVSSSAWGEAFPNVIGEAMSCETTCIVTDVGDSQYIVSTTGIIVPPGNTNKLAEAMLDIMNVGRKERIALGKKARRRILKKFRIVNITNNYLSIYENISS